VPLAPALVRSFLLLLLLLFVLPDDWSLEAVWSLELEPLAAPLSLEAVPDDDVLGLEDEELPPFIEELLSLEAPEDEPAVPELEPVVPALMPDVPAAPLYFDDEELLEGDCELL
jgi:hypothetical protein